MKTEFVNSELEVIRFAEKDIIMNSALGDPDCESNTCLTGQETDCAFGYEG